MRSIPQQAAILLNTVLLQEAQLRAAGIKAENRMAAMTPGVEGLLQKFQDELLEAQREAGVALAAALNVAGGKHG